MSMSMEPTGVSSFDIALHGVLSALAQEPVDMFKKKHCC